MASERPQSPLQKMGTQVRLTMQKIGLYEKPPASLAAQGLHQHHFFDLRDAMGGLGLGAPKGHDGAAAPMMYGGVDLRGKQRFSDVIRTPDELVATYGTDLDRGLTADQAAAALQRYGPNALAKPPQRTKWQIFLDQFKDLLVILLIVAAIVAFAIAIGTEEDWDQYIPPVFIILIVVANALLGVWMEGDAGDAVAALEGDTRTTVDVVRDGASVTVDEADVVPGDLVRLERGDVVPADCQVISASECGVEEKMFTGEPDAIKKYPAAAEGELVDVDRWARRNMMYKGCPVANGDVTAVVVGTGMATKMGSIAELLTETEESSTPLQEKLDDLGKKLGIASLAISCVVFVIGTSLERGTSPDSTQEPWVQMLLISVALTVAAVPEGLPVATTIALALGMKTMANKNAVIKTLKSVETLGQASTICTDKTGTLTKGEMTAVGFTTATDSYTVSGVGYDPAGTISGPEGRSRDQTLVISRVCNGAALEKDPSGQWTASGNLTDRALLVLSHKTADDGMYGHYEVKRKNPFDANRKMMSMVVGYTGPEGSNVFDANTVALVKGAPNIILDLCTKIERNGTVEPITADDVAAIKADVDRASAEGFRVLALTYSAVIGESHDDFAASAVENDLVFVAAVSCMDPPREEVPPAIVKAENAGVRVVMITGDYLKTAESIANQIGIITSPGAPGQGVIDCSELRALPADSPELGALVSNTKVFARAKPEDKITIVTVLQSFGGVVAMTGDGVNDSPALKKADIGVAMGITGTPAAQAAADMILTDDSFAAIVLAIEEGRRIYANIQKFIYYLLSTNVAEVFLILIAVMMDLESPLVPVQILWLNFITDGLPALALANEELEDHVMLERPRPRSYPIIDRSMAIRTVFHTILLTALTLGTYIWGLDRFTGDWRGRPNTHGDLGEKELADGVQSAQTMVILIIVLAELFRAYSCRSAFHSVFAIGIFSNTWMQWSVISGIILTLLIGIIPGVTTVFGTQFLNGTPWAWVICLSFLPFWLDELIKVYARATFKPYGATAPPPKSAAVIPIGEV